MTKVKFTCVVLLAAAVLLSGCGAAERELAPRVPHTAAYDYMKHADSVNGVTMHLIRVQPEALDFVANRSNVIHAGRVGINGGFFYQQDLLSIAVEDDRPAAGERGDYGSGWFNARYPRGTLVYDKIERAFSVQVVSGADEISVSDRSRYWAQGGISMGLTAGPEWRAQAESEAAPFPDGKHLRSAMVYNEAGNVLLVVTSTTCTLEELRDAIVRLAAAEKLVDGIFLDGDGSSQLLAAEEALPGDGRPVVQMIAIDDEAAAAAHE